MAISYTDFSTQVDGQELSDWSLVETGAITDLYSYLYEDGFEGLNTFHGFTADAQAGRIGGQIVKRGNLAVDPSEPDPSTAASELSQVTYWDMLWDTPGTFADGEIYARVFGQHGIGVVFRTNYVFHFNFGSNDTRVFLSTHVGNSIASVNSFTFNERVGKQYKYDWYNLRVQFIGTAIKLRVWRLGDAEPTFWNLELTDATYASGGVGLSATGNILAPYVCDIFAVESSATPGAQFPPPGISTPSAPSIQSVSVDSGGNASVSGSTFSGDAGASHLNTRWQVDLQSGDFSDPVADTMFDYSHRTSVQFPSLPIGSYKVRAAYKDDYEQEGSFGSSQNFTVSGRAAPETVTERALEGDIWLLRDLKNQNYYGLYTNSSTSSGPGGSGASATYKYYDPNIGRYCKRILIGGTDQQQTDFEYYGIHLKTLLDPDRSKSSFVYSISNYAKVERVLVSQATQSNPTRGAFVGVHLESAINRTVTNGGEEFLGVGFRTADGGNWRAYLSTFAGAGGGALIVSEDTGIAEEEALWWEVQLDGWNKQIRWYAGGTLITSYDVQSGDMDSFGEGGMVAGVRCLGEHVLEYAASPIIIPHRVVQEAST